MITALAKRIFKVINVRWILIIVITFFLSLFYLSFNLLVNYNKGTMVMSLNYPEAEKGLYPDGTRFNIFKIKSEEVLDLALAKYSDTGITVDNLRSRIDVYEKASNKDAEKVRDAQALGEDYKYIPNEYTISYSQKNKFAKNHTIEMLNAIALAYEEVFKSNHADNNEVLKLDIQNYLEYENYEYVEIADLLLDKVNTIEAYISKRNSENSNFISRETGETFENVKTMLENFKEIEIEKYKSFVISSAVAKDRGAYINKLWYNINNLTFEKRKAVTQADFAKNTMQKYDPNITGVAFIPSLDKDNEFYMNRTKTGIDYLALTAYSAGITAEKTTKEIENNNFLIGAFSNPDTNGENADMHKITAEQMLTGLKDNLVHILDVAAKTDNDYILYKTREYIKFDIPEKSLIGSLKLFSTAVFAFWVFFATALLFIAKTQFPRRMYI